ncbi:MAG: hypothetical protein KC983_04540 [Phycisphaerales bacterium]|nr:hypothetical protein [Phycisphaerales bacterium]
MAAGILLGIIVAITSAITAGQQHTLEAHTRIAGALASEEMLSRLVAVDYDDLLAWNGYTESVGSMTDVHGAAMPDVFNLIGRSVTVTTEMKTITELGVKIRGRMIQVQSFDQNGQILSEINHFVPEHADDAGSASAIGPEDRRELYA